MQVQFATIPGSVNKRNEDWVGACPTVALVLDGVTAPDGMPTGCIHDVPWYVARLGRRLLTEAAGNPDRPLPECLATAITSVAALHANTCDLSSPGTPMATVAIVRLLAEQWDYLVLSDATLVLDLPTGIEVVTDKSVARFAAAELAALHEAIPGTPEHFARMRAVVTEQRRYRNRPEGYWLAAADPVAADHAVTRTFPLADLRRAAIMTDGASALVDTYQAWTWTEMLDVLDSQGPGPVLREVRELERADSKAVTWPRFKISDDATLAYLTP